MFYQKNVPVWERWLRIVLGLALIGWTILSGWPGLVIGLAFLSAAFLIVTGFIGFCPACALVGRKLKEKQ